MAQSKHTPGPWEYREIAPYDDGLGYVSADGNDIIHAGVSDLPAGENRANAHLIAAAPELLEAVHNLMDILRDYDAIDNLDVRIREARAAIAKAEGAS